MKKLLITGFEPFGGEKINPSWEAVKLLPDKIGDFELNKIEIPVVFGKAAKTVIKKAEEIKPDAIICVGQAGGRTGVTPEMVAINLRFASITDNEGNQPKDVPCVPDGERWRKLFLPKEPPALFPILPELMSATTLFITFFIIIKERKQKPVLSMFRSFRNRQAINPVFRLKQLQKPLKLLLKRYKKLPAVRQGVFIYYEFL